MVSVANYKLTLWSSRAMGPIKSLFKVAFLPLQTQAGHNARHFPPSEGVLSVNWPGGFFFRRKMAHRSSRVYNSLVFTWTELTL